MDKRIIHGDKQVKVLFPNGVARIRNCSTTFVPDERRVFNHKAYHDLSNLRNDWSPVTARNEFKEAPSYNLKNRKLINFFIAILAIIILLAAVAITLRHE